jgi:hypothetical protein
MKLMRMLDRPQKRKPKVKTGLAEYRSATFPKRRRNEANGTP